MSLSPYLTIYIHYTILSYMIYIQCSFSKLVHPPFNEVQRFKTTCRKCRHLYLSAPFSQLVPPGIFPVPPPASYALAIIWWLILMSLTTRYYRIIKSYSRVDYVEGKIGLTKDKEEKKLSQMILETKFLGMLDQVYIIYLPSSLTKFHILQRWNTWYLQGVSKKLHFSGL